MKEVCVKVYCGSSGSHNPDIDTTPINLFKGGLEVSNAGECHEKFMEEISGILIQHCHHIPPFREL
jgi:hypothetical protein